MHNGLKTFHPALLGDRRLGCLKEEVQKVIAGLGAFTRVLRPIQGRWICFPVSWGIAALNPRLIARIPSGCRISAPQSVGRLRALPRKESRLQVVEGTHAQRFENVPPCPLGRPSAGLPEGGSPKGDCWVGCVYTGSTTHSGSVDLFPGFRGYRCAQPPT